MDMLYNHVVRPLLGAAQLPPNPMQRRLACLSAGGMNLVAGTLLLLNMSLAAYIVGGCLLVLQAIVISTHFCLLSWFYEAAARAVGSWHRPIEMDKAQQLLRQGATVIDVRSPQEYAQLHLPKAVNMPLESLADSLHQLPTGTLLVHCKSGMRSNMATGLLRKRGIKDVHNLGGFDRAKSIVEAA
jgi:rhodanese-related sulfurtransferase